MPEYLAPGVFIEEIERGPRPIEGVATSTAAFLGETERGRTKPRLVTSFNEYRRHFGSAFAEGKYMPYALSGFFDNGGRRAYVCRIVGANAAAATRTVGGLKIDAIGPGAWGDRVFVKLVGSTTTTGPNKDPVGFRLQVAYWQTPTSDGQYPDPFDRTQPRTSAAADDDRGFRQPRLRRSDLAGLFREAARGQLGAGRGFDRRARSDRDAADRNVRRRSPAAPTAPRRPSSTSRAKTPTATCAPACRRSSSTSTARSRSSPRPRATERRRRRRAHALREQQVPLRGHRQRQEPRPMPNEIDPRSDFDTLVCGASTTPGSTPPICRAARRRLVPPSGHVLGLYARTDIDRGVWKAPANDVLRGVFDLEYYVDTGVQEVLNPRGVNAIRRFPGRGIRVWGARTLSTNSLWKYVSVRRLFIFLERSIYEGTQWVVFEPNDERLWERVKDTIRLFLRTQWRNGALMGLTEEQAFTIACDRSTMTAGRHPERPADLRDRHRAGPPGRIRHLPHLPEHRRGAVLTAAAKETHAMARNDPLRNFRFRVEIDQITQAFFSEVAIGETTNEPIDYREGNESDACPQAAGPDQVRQHHAEVGGDRFHRALRLAQEDRRRPDQGPAQDREDHRHRRVRRRQGELRRLRGLADANTIPSDLNGKGNEVFIELLELVNEGIERTR